MGFARRHDVPWRLNSECVWSQLKERTLDWQGLKLSWTWWWLRWSLDLTSTEKRRATYNKSYLQIRSNSFRKCIQGIYAFKLVINWYYLFTYKINVFVIEFFHQAVQETYIKFRSVIIVIYFMDNNYFICQPLPSSMTQLTENNIVFSFSELQRHFFRSEKWTKNWAPDNSVTLVTGVIWNWEQVLEVWHFLCFSSRILINLLSPFNN